MHIISWKIHALVRVPCSAGNGTHKRLTKQEFLPHRLSIFSLPKYVLREDFNMSAQAYLVILVVFPALNFCASLFASAFTVLIDLPYVLCMWMINPFFSVQLLSFGSCDNYMQLLLRLFEAISIKHI